MNSESAPNPSVLAVRDLTAGYGRQQIIFDINADFPPGKISALLGPNGAGKSTLLKALFGLARVFHGDVLLDGRPLRAGKAMTLVKEGIAYVPQSRNVFPSLSVMENLEIGTYVRSGGSREKAFEVFPDLKRMLNFKVGKLSGGQRVMVAVARALMSNPRMLLLDEATAGLSPMIASNLWKHIATLADLGVGVVAVEQNVQLALRHSHEVYVLTSGSIRVHGTASEVQAVPNLQELFLSGVAPRGGS